MAGHQLRTCADLARRHPAQQQVRLAGLGKFTAGKNAECYTCTVRYVKHPSATAGKHRLGCAEPPCSSAGKHKAEYSAMAVAPLLPIVCKQTLLLPLSCSSSRMPPILLVPFRDINGNFAAFQHQQLALQRGPQVCGELTRLRPPRVKVSVQGATKKRVTDRTNCYRIQCSIALKGGYRILWNSLSLLSPSAEQDWIPFAGLQQLTPRRSCVVNLHSKCTTKGIGFPSRVCPGYYEVRTMRLDVMVQVVAPTGWRRQTTATQVGYAWCMAHLAWVFGRDKPWLLGKKLQRMVMKPLPAQAIAAAAAAAAAAAEEEPAAGQPPQPAPAGAQGAEGPEGAAGGGEGAANLVGAGVVAAGAGAEGGGDDSANENDDENDDDEGDLDAF